MNKMPTRGSLLILSAVLAACAAPPESNRTEHGYTPARPEKSEASTQADSGAVQPVPAAPPSPVQDAAHEYELRRTVVGQRAVLASAPIGVCCPSPPPLPHIANTERYQHLDDNPIKLVAEHPVSTFSIDVDTGSYANVRRYLNAGQLPPQDAVRVEELINYFDYDYPVPKSRDTPFHVATELAAAPWNPEAILLRIGIKGFEVPAADRPPANLVFLIDVSGSMHSPDKLPLLKNAFRLLTDQLTERDRVAIVVYAGSSGVVLEPTPGDRKQTILDAIGRLEAGGSTNGADGIKRAYELARAGRIEGGINRVILATDGDFNVGVVNFEALVDMAERERASGVALTTLGFGTGNYNDQLLERLADAGNGNYSYIDTLAEARKVLVSELSSTLVTIAKDVKIQVEFNPAQVVEYRLIGYENRMLAREDFNNDRVDAGDIGAGHRVTALYEIVPVGAKGRIDNLRYGANPATRAAKTGELAHVRLRYKDPDADTSKLLEYPVRKTEIPSIARASADMRFAAGVAAFGQLLRGGKYLESFDYDDVEALVQGAIGEDRSGYRKELVSLVALADSLAGGSQKQQVGRVEE